MQMKSGQSSNLSFLHRFKKRIINWNFDIIRPPLFFPDWGLPLNIFLVYKFSPEGDVSAHCSVGWLVQFKYISLGVVFSQQIILHLNNKTE